MYQTFTMDVYSTVKKSVTDNLANDISLKFAQKTLQDYEVISVIGNGSFGTCYKVRDKATGELYAWKGMDYDELTDTKKESLICEISVLRQLQHPNIVQYYHHLVNTKAKSIFIVMEYCEGGDLAQLIAKARTDFKRFKEKYVWRVLFQICKALQLCHTKIKQGTILHRDIKPANIFLDAAGNAKLGDFGLARMLRRDDPFADTFVGTPFYMSPEIVKGTKYDRKSDVWAVGCLVYEMCALRPPFNGREFGQLSANISNGKFSSIPDVYSVDLQEIISYMLEVDNDLRPGIEVITRHPVVVRNISDLGIVFPKLVDAEGNFCVTASRVAEARCKLSYTPIIEHSSSMFSEQYSFNEGYGQRRMSISDVFTADLCPELFYSAKQRVFHGKFVNKLQRSDPALYESIRRDHFATIESHNASFTKKTSRAQKQCEYSPDILTQNVFDEMVQLRLHAIRTQESMLEQRELALNARENELKKKEKRLQQLERSLNQKLQSNERVRNTLERSRMPLPSEVIPPVITKSASTLVKPVPPPIPPRKPVNHDDTYCSIEPYESIQHLTVAKLDLAALPIPKAFPNTIRKVTFQSPQKFIKYDVENIPLKTVTANNNATSISSHHMQSSVSSKTSDGSADSQTTTHRRKSILSIFRLYRGKDASNKTATTAAVTNEKSQHLPYAPKNLPSQQCTKQIKPSQPTAKLTNIWTKEHKRAAFDLLAAMNAVGERDTGSDTQRAISARHQFRLSVRERNTLQRNRIRRSLIIVGGGQQQQILDPLPNGISP